MHGFLQGCVKLSEKFIYWQNRATSCSHREGTHCHNSHHQHPTLGTFCIPDVAIELFPRGHSRRHKGTVQAGGHGQALLGAGMAVGSPCVLGVQRTPCCRQLTTKMT